MGRYDEDAKQLLRLVGGKENIAAVSHCMTRMRFALVDPGKADVKAIEAMKVVKGSFTQSGQFQAVSYTHLDVYKRQLLWSMKESLSVFASITPAKTATNSGRATQHWAGLTALTI